MRFFLLLILFVKTLNPVLGQERIPFQWAILPVEVSHQDWVLLGKNLTSILSRIELDGEIRGLTENERQDLAQRALEQAVNQLIAKENAARKELDRLILISRTDQLNVIQAQQNWERIRSERVSFQQQPPRMENTPTQLPLKQIPEMGKPLESTSNLRVLREQHKLNLIIVPRLFSVQGFLGINIQVYDSKLDVVASYEEWMSPEEVLDRIKGIQTWLVNVLLNRPWAGIKLIATPSTAEIWINNQFKGLGAVDLGIVEPGSYQVVVRALGFQTFQESIDLKLGEIYELNLVLLTRETSAVNIATEPEKARVWLGGLYLGETPIRIPSLEKPTYLEIEKEGFNPVSFTLWPEQKEVSITLEPLSEKRRLEEARQWFYYALGSFTISFFTYIMFRGLESEYLLLSNEYLKDYLNTPPGFRTQQQLDRVNLSYTFQQTFQNGGYALLGLTAVLFGWTIWELFRYIDTAERGR